MVVTLTTTACPLPAFHHLGWRRGTLIVHLAASIVVSLPRRITAQEGYQSAKSSGWTHTPSGELRCPPSFLSRPLEVCVLVIVSSPSFPPFSLPFFALSLLVQFRYTQRRDRCLVIGLLTFNLVVSSFSQCSYSLLSISCYLSVHIPASRLLCCTRIKCNIILDINRRSKPGRVPEPRASRSEFHIR